VIARRTDSVVAVPSGRVIETVSCGPKRGASSAGGVGQVRNAAAATPPGALDAWEAPDPIKAAATPTTPANED
jgi:hypothetical protein